MSLSSGSRAFPTKIFPTHGCSRSGGTPLANLWLTQAKQLGVETDRFADSTGTIELYLARLPREVRD